MKNELIEWIKKGDVETVIFGFSDVQGRIMGKRLTSQYCLNSNIDKGIHFCSYLLFTNSSLDTLERYDKVNQESYYPDYIAKPDWETLKKIHWQEKTALILCDVYDQNYKLINISPRNILKQQIKKLSNKGYIANIASELEFYLFKDSYEKNLESKFENLKKINKVREDYHILEGGKFEPFYKKVRSFLQSLDIAVESTKGETGYGQHEINIKYKSPLLAADEHTLLKYSIKELAVIEDYSVTFMSKPFSEWPGSGGHIHINLIDKKSGENIFKLNHGEMSKEMMWFLGGIIKYTREFMLLFAPVVNSYKRFDLDHWCPVDIGWGIDNRNTTYRVVGRDNNLRIESRVPGADVNPYLAYAAIIAMGLKGIESKIPLNDEFNDYGCKRRNSNKLPNSLYEAIDCWKKSEMVKELLGSEVYEHFLYLATLEQRRFNHIVTNWERSEYFKEL